VACAARMFLCREYLKVKRCPSRIRLLRKHQTAFLVVNKLSFSFSQLLLSFLFYSLFFIIASIFICCYIPFSFPVLSTSPRSVLCLAVETLHHFHSDGYNSLVISTCLVDIDPSYIITNTLDVCKTLPPPSFWLH
jgi:hypothetical protein